MLWNSVYPYVYEKSPQHHDCEFEDFSRPMTTWPITQLSKNACFKELLHNAVINRSIPKSNPSFVISRFYWARFE
jgi:hypothetical protein